MHTQAAPNRLRELRLAGKHRLLDVAKVADRDTSIIGRYERGLTPIPDDVKGHLAEFFGVSRAYLMGWDDDDAPTEAAA